MDTPQWQTGRRLKRSVPIPNQHRDVRWLEDSAKIRHCQILLAVSVEIPDYYCLGIGPGGWIGRTFAECSVAVTKQDYDDGGLELEEAAAGH